MADDLFAEFDPLKAGKKTSQKTQGSVGGAGAVTHHQQPQFSPPPRDPTYRPALPNVYDPQTAKFAELTGIDLATAAIHLRAATLRGASFEEAVDRFYANNGAHVRDESPQRDAAAQVATQRRVETAQADQALARALAEEDREQHGTYEAPVDEIVAQLEDMGFEKSVALVAVERSRTLREATDYCLLHTTVPPARAGSSSSRAAAAGSTRLRNGALLVQKNQSLSSSRNPTSLTPSQTARMAAMRVSKSGRLFKLASAKSVLGARWQARTFVLKNGVLSYYTKSDGPPSKTVNLWHCYAFRAGKKTAGKQHAFAIYSSDEGLGAEHKHSKMLLAADDDRAANEWLSAIYRAAGRPHGAVVKISRDGTLRCAVNFPASALGEIDAYSETQTTGVLS